MTTFLACLSLRSNRATRLQNHSDANERYVTIGVGANVERPDAVAAIQRAALPGRATRPPFPAPTSRWRTILELFCQLLKGEDVIEDFRRYRRRVSRVYANGSTLFWPHRILSVS
jgi:hypothetical protein